MFNCNHQLIESSDGEFVCLFTKLKFKPYVCIYLGSWLYLRCGQATVLQSLCCFCTPEQVLPPKHCLCLLCLPPPQLAEHPLQMLQEPHVATTIIIRKQPNKHNILPIFYCYIKLYVENSSSCTSLNDFASLDSCIDLKAIYKHLHLMSYSKPSMLCKSITQAF